MTNFLISYSKAFMAKFGHMLGIARDEVTPEAKVFWRLKDTDSFYMDITYFLQREVDWCEANKKTVYSKLKCNLTSSTNDENAWAIQHEVQRIIKYVGDAQNYRMSEYWASIQEILNKLSDDCDGGALLIYCVGILKGIPADRLHLVWGETTGGGHCYVVYLSEINGLEYVLDWCFFPDDRVIVARMPYLLDQRYYCGDKEWGRCNHLRGYKK